MKHSVAAWLLVGLSLGIPQFCKGEEVGGNPLLLGAGHRGVLRKMLCVGPEAVPGAGKGWRAAWRRQHALGSPEKCSQSQTQCEGAEQERGCRVPR